MSGLRKTPGDDDEINMESQAKRQKVRKGTRSCWECKRRKLKCVFSAPTDAFCVRCRRRGTNCVSQEFPEEVSAPADRSRFMGERIVRVENMLEQLIQKVGTGRPVPGRGIMSDDASSPCATLPTPASTRSDSSRYLALYKPSTDNGPGDNDILHEDCGLCRLRSAPDVPAGPGKYSQLSRALYEALPSRDDIEMICKAKSHGNVLFHQFLSVPHNVLEQDGLESPQSLLETPGPNVHPVLIAKHMLNLAVLLQNLYPDLHGEIKGLLEEPRAMMRRLADTAISLVTTNDELLGSIEGLECVMMESFYQATLGNLRRSWIATRRAMVIAQVMGLHRSGSVAQYTVLDPRTKAHPQFIWFRLVYYDRHLCLMLGLPQGSLDRRMASDAMFAQDTPLGRLERIHCVISSRVLERNEADPGSYDYAFTQSLDLELQRAARSLPSQWWLTPNLKNAADNGQTSFWEMRRLFMQLFHYDLLNQLHLPYMLRSTTERKYEYSRMTCVTVSREVLSRFIMLRSFNRGAFSCRSVDFLALMAAMTLLLAHLDSHRSPQAENLLAHQYLSDRAMMEQAQENMTGVNQLNDDALSAQSADLLRRLLAIEAEAADGRPHGADSVSVQTPGMEMVRPEEDDDDHHNSDNVVRVHIPYFGIIKIAREGVISRETLKPQPSGSSKSMPMPRPRSTLPASRDKTSSSDPPGRSSSFSETPHVGAGPPPVQAGYGGVEELRTAPRTASNNHMGSQPQLGGGDLSFPSTAGGDDNGFLPSWHFATELPSNTKAPDALLQQLSYPGATAGADDWAFQGVDMAFFDSLMRRAGDDGGGGVEWTA